MALFWWHGGKIHSLVGSSIGIRKEISKDGGKKRKGMGDVRGALSRGTPGASITGNKSSTSAVPAATQIHTQCWAATCTGETHAGKTHFFLQEKKRLHSRTQSCSSKPVAAHRHRALGHFGSSHSLSNSTGDANCTHHSLTTEALTLTYMASAQWKPFSTSSKVIRAPEEPTCNLVIISIQQLKANRLNLDLNTLPPPFDTVFRFRNTKLLS